MQDYIKQAMVTLSPEFHGELVPMKMLAIAVSQGCVVAEKLDAVKKSLFYGRAFPAGKPEGTVRDPDCTGITVMHAQLMLHGVLGVFTEAGELLEGVRDDKIDPVNIKEEIGDLFWYCALMCFANDFTFEEVMETNIAKLRARYPEQFTEYDALHRNLSAERKILEGDNGTAAHLSNIKGRVEDRGPGQDGNDK